MSTKLPFRSNPSGCARGCARLDRHTQAYREYLLARGNAAGYVRSCEAAVVHLSIWMKQANKGLNDVGEELLSEFIEHQLLGCQCATSARHPSTVRAALGHLLVVLRAGNVIAPKSLDMTAEGQELGRSGQYMEQVRGLAPKTREGALRLVGALLRKQLQRRRYSVRGHHAGARTPLLC